MWSDTITSNHFHLKNIKKNMIQILCFFNILEKNICIYFGVAVAWYECCVSCYLQIRLMWSGGAPGTGLHLILALRSDDAFQSLVFAFHPSFIYTFYLSFSLFICPCLFFNIIFFTFFFSYLYFIVVSSSWSTASHPHIFFAYIYIYFFFPSSYMLANSRG